VKSGLDIWSELARFQILEIFDQVVVILGLDSLLELFESYVNLLDHLASELNFKLLVKVRDVFTEYIFKTNNILTLRYLSLEIQVCANSPLNS
jgi:hypothetical protein